MKPSAKLLSITLLSLPLLVPMQAVFAADATPLLPLNAKLEPITLADAKESSKVAKAESSTVETLKSGKTLLKTDIQKNKYVPKSPAAAAKSGKLLAPISVKGTKGAPLVKPSLGDRTQNLKLAPLALQPSQKEIADKLSNEIQVEREQIAALWQATIARSPEINFVIQQLLPSKKGRAKTIAMRFTAAAIYGGLGAVNMMVPGVPSNMATNMASQLISMLLGMQDEKEAKKQQNNSHEQIILFQMVRETAEKMVERFRLYKKDCNSLSVAERDFEDLSNMIAQTRGTQDPSEQVKLEYVLRKQKRGHN